MTLFDFGRANRLSWSRIVSDDDYSLTVGRWLNGRMLGCYISLFVRYVWKRKPASRGSTEPIP